MVVEPRIAIEIEVTRGETVAQWRPRAMRFIPNPRGVVMDDLMRGGSAVLFYVAALCRGGKSGREAAAGPVDRIVATFRRWRRARAPRAPPGLGSFDDCLLHDIGLSRSQAQFESGKPFWQG